MKCYSDRYRTCYLLPDRYFQLTYQLVLAVDTLMGLYLQSIDMIGSDLVRESSRWISVLIPEVLAADLPVGVSRSGTFFQDFGISK